MEYKIRSVVFPHERKVYKRSSDIYKDRTLLIEREDDNGKSKIHYFGADGLAAMCDVKNLEFGDTLIVEKPRYAKFTLIKTI